VNAPEGTDKNHKNLSPDSCCPDRVPNITQFGLPIEAACSV
jgi:hypothetical protein